MRPHLSAVPPPFLPVYPICLVRPILPAPPPLTRHPLRRAERDPASRQAPGPERCVGQRLRQTRNASAPYFMRPDASLVDLPAWPGYVNSLQIKRALALLEEGEGLQFVPAAHRTHTIAGAFMALTGDSLHEVERQCGRIGQALASMGVCNWQIAALTVEGIKQCHHRLAHRTITMAQLANHVIQYGTRASTMMLLEVPQAVRSPALQILRAMPSGMREAPPAVAAAAPQVFLQTAPPIIAQATSHIAPTVGPFPGYRCIIPRPTIMLPSAPRPPQQ